jgi:hypothetical protein
LEGAGNVPVNFFYMGLLSYDDAAGMIIKLLKQGYVSDVSNSSKFVNRKKKKYIDVRKLVSLYFSNVKLRDYVAARKLFKKVKFHLRVRFERYKMIKRHKGIKLGTVPMPEFYTMPLLTKKRRKKRRRRRPIPTFMFHNMTTI